MFDNVVTFRKPPKTVHTGILLIDTVHSTNVDDGITNAVNLPACIAVSFSFVDEATLIFTTTTYIHHTSLSEIPMESIKDITGHVADLRDSGEIPHVLKLTEGVK